MSETKKITKHEVKWLGFDHSISHRVDGEHYVFRRGDWIEIKDYHAPRYEKKAMKNDNWEYRTSESVPMTTVHMARFLGIPGKDALKYSLSEKDQYDNPIKETIRDYTFKKDIWVELDPRDVKRFADKAAANVTWEYMKEIVPVGTKPSLLSKIKEKVKKKEEKVEEVEA